MTERFTGFPLEVVDLYEGLRVDNTKAYWTAHKDVYERAARGPMDALIAEMRGDYGEFRTFRPYRDVRFSKDKTPYKDHIGTYTESAGGSGYYVAVSAEGLHAACGMYHMANDQLERYRAAVDAERTGAQLAKITTALTKAGYTVTSHGELKRAPRGYPQDHVRIDLLRAKGITTGRVDEPGPWLASRKAKDRVVRTWRAAKPLIDWLDEHVGPSMLPPPEPR